MGDGALGITIAVGGDVRMLALIQPQVFYRGTAGLIFDIRGAENEGRSENSRREEVI